MSSLPPQPTHTTCWTMILGASKGDAQLREEFAHRYSDVLRTYLDTRWRSSPRLLAELEDAMQEIFVECFRGGGVLDKATPQRPGGFRPYLHGVARNVARRFEERQAKRRENQATSEMTRIGDVDHESDLAAAFDCAWARSVMAEARGLLEARVEALGKKFRQRAELLRLRFEEGMPIREIAKRWDIEPARLHHVYAQARRDFALCLRTVVAFHLPGSDKDIEEECRLLIGRLQRRS